MSFAKILVPSLAAFSLFWLGACAASNELKEVPNASKLGSMNSKTKPVSGKTNLMNKKQQIVFAKNALADWKNVDFSEIKLLEIKSVTWRSGALGCPEKGRVYTQALVPGRMILLAIRDELFRYHADLEGAPFHCPDGRAESSSIDPADL